MSSDSSPDNYRKCAKKRAKKVAARARNKASKGKRNKLPVDALKVSSKKICRGRMTVGNQDGIFLKGLRSQFTERLPLTDENLARRDEDLCRLIDFGFPQNKRNERRDTAILETLGMDTTVPDQQRRREGREQEWRHRAAHPHHSKAREGQDVQKPSYTKLRISKQPGASENVLEHWRGSETHRHQRNECSDHRHHHQFVADDLGRIHIDSQHGRLDENQEKLRDVSSNEAVYCRKQKQRAPTGDAHSQSLLLRAARSPIFAPMPTVVLPSRSSQDVGTSPQEDIPQPFFLEQESHRRESERVRFSGLRVSHAGEVRQPFSSPVANPKRMPSPPNIRNDNTRSAHHTSMKNPGGRINEACCWHSHSAGDDKNTRTVRYIVRSSPDLVPDRLRSEHVQAGSYNRTPTMPHTSMFPESHPKENLRTAHRVSSLEASPMVLRKNRLSISPETSDYSPPKLPFLPEYPSRRNVVNSNEIFESSPSDQYAGGKIPHERRDSRQYEKKTLTEQEMQDSSEFIASSPVPHHETEHRHRDVNHNHRRMEYRNRDTDHRSADEVQFDFANPEPPRGKPDRKQTFFPLSHSTPMPPVDPPTLEASMEDRYLEFQERLDKVLGVAIKAMKKEVELDDRRQLCEYYMKKLRLLQDSCGSQDWSQHSAERHILRERKLNEINERSDQDAGSMTPRCCRAHYNRWRANGDPTDYRQQKHANSKQASLDVRRDRKLKMTDHGDQPMCRTEYDHDHSRGRIQRLPDGYPMPDVTHLPGLHVIDYENTTPYNVFRHGTRKKVADNVHHRKRMLYHE